MSFSPLNFARVIAWCTLLTFGSSTLANAAAMLGQVLCIGDDGHVAVELVSGVDCDHPAHSAPATELPTIQATHCGGCTDFELSSASVVSNPQVAKALERTADEDPARTLIEGFYIAVVVIARQRLLLSSSAFDLPNLTLIARRTVVLIV